ncbi:hypothetical protein B484DRAFT_455478 [Ochromonadaceae sp. CCMP2298]|nr:hypothetical protein B484DRAFT_455478 [Ochromonadaceae sp. CCMP2298]
MSSKNLMQCVSIGVTLLHYNLPILNLPIRNATPLKEAARNHHSTCSSCSRSALSACLRYLLASPLQAGLLNCIASTSWRSMGGRMLINIPPQLVNHRSAQPLLLLALAGPNSSTARQGWFGGAAAHLWEPLEGLLAQIPARLFPLALPEHDEPQTRVGREAAAVHWGQQGRAGMREVLLWRTVLVLRLVASASCCSPTLLVGARHLTGPVSKKLRRSEQSTAYPALSRRCTPREASTK